MPIIDLPITRFSETAYSSKTIPDQPAAKVKRDDDFSVLLPWGNTERVIPTRVMMDIEPLKLKKAEDDYQERQSIIGLYDNAINHIQIRPGSLTKITHFWMLAYSFGKTLGLVVGIMLLITLLFIFGTHFIFPKHATLYEFTVNLLHSEFVDKGLLFVGGIAESGFLFMWFISFLYFEWFGPKKGKGAEWALNRQTGMVTIYRQQGKWTNRQRVAIEKPFYEFDAYSVSALDREMIAYYRLDLQHRYQKELLIKNIFGDEAEDKREIYAIWDFIQNYMDISQPLPELGDFELFRAYDPTSIEYDKHTARNPRYWRDMSKEQWQSVCKEMDEKILTLDITSRSDIMAPHIG